MPGIQVRENERGHENVEQEIVCLDHRSNRARDYGPAQLSTVFEFGKGIGSNSGCGHRFFS
jgi:hypothetical protein